MIKIDSNFLNPIKTLCGVVLLCFSLPLFAKDGDDFTYDGVIYTVISESEKTCRTKAGDLAQSKAGNDFSGELEIPAKVFFNGEEYSVIEIGSLSFYDNRNITSLKLNANIKIIGEQAFYLCLGLTGSLKIPDSVITIGDNAFRNCYGLTGSLKIPDSVITIGEHAFLYCHGFNGTLTLGNSLQTIGYDAFGNCEGFTGSLKIPDSVTSIGTCAFDGCKGFDGTLTIPNSIKTIRARTFNNCGFTGTLKIPESVTTIGDMAFNYCSGFTGDLKIPDSVISIGEGAFYNCNGFNGTLTIGNSITDIPKEAFGSCANLTGSLNIPESVITIGERAFSSCKGFTGPLIIPNSVKTIGANAFIWCRFTGHLIIPDSIITIGESAFYEDFGGEGYESVTIGKGVKSIGRQAFVNIKQVISLPDNPPIINPQTFYVWEYTEPQVYVLNKSSYQKYTNADVWKDFQNIDYLLEPKELTLTSLSLENKTNKSSLKTTETLNIKCDVTSTVSPILNEPIDCRYDVLWSAFPQNSVTFSATNEFDNYEMIALVANDASGEVKIKAEIEDYPEINYTYTINVSPLNLGDADDDRAIDVADIITTANWIVGKKSDSFCYINADSYKDFTIDVGDLTATTDIILGKTKTRGIEAQSSSESFDIEDSLSASIYTDPTNSGIRIGVSLNGSGFYKALQADIPIPEGVAIENVEVGPIASSHSLVYNIQEDLLKVVVFSAENRLFEPSEGELFSITCSGTLPYGALSIDNIVAIGDDSQKYNLSYEGASLGMTTGTDNFKTESVKIISGIGYLEIFAPKDLEFNIYNLKGGLEYSSHTTSTPAKVRLSKGFYIVNIDNKNIKTIIR
ncbi:MAG: leucine-rich repeat protein [Muribaculaceae bacterium]|nr:leucine-rich repeat protein [Muribaculaceae bacterium]